MAAGLLLPNLDAALESNLPMIPPGDQVESARDTMSTIATVTASVGGLAFSMTLVTVALGGQLYSPRVVRVFRGNRLYQATLGAFIGTFVYSLLVLVSMSERPPFVPELSVALAILVTVLSFGLFTAFLTDLVRSTEAETVVRRLAQSGQEALENRWQRGVGSERDPLRETRDWAHKGEPGEPTIARSPRSGFLLSIDGEVVSGLNRSIPSGGTTPALVDLLQTDAAISPGNSGGALVGADGRLIGINVAFIPPQARAVSIGFAIPAPRVRDAIGGLLADGDVDETFLGVILSPLTPQIAEQFGIAAQGGAIVLEVEPGSPAAEAGLRPGDVIVAVDGRPVDAVEQVLAALRRSRAGDRLPLTVVRGGQRREVAATLEER